MGRIDDYDSSQQKHGYDNLVHTHWRPSKRDRIRVSINSGQRLPEP